MKHLYLTLAFLLPFIGNTVKAQTGMTVFGDCYVSDTASIGFFGAELTLEGDVIGEGTLVMAGEKPQTIASQNRSVDHLVVTNPTVVQVKGTLTVCQSLTIRRGTLTVLPLSQLHIDPTATVALSPNARLLTNQLVWQTRDDAAIPEGALQVKRIL